MNRIAQRLACAVLLAATLPLAAMAGPEEDYVAARDKAIAASLAAAKAGKSSDEAVAKREEAALKDLGKRMAAVLGPLKFKGLGTPTYTLQVLSYSETEPVAQLDGLSFANKDFTSRIIVTPEGVFQGWLAARAKDKEAPAGFAGGLKPAVTTDYFYNNALSFDGGGYTPYVALPVAAVPGETAFAMLGLYSDDIPGNAAPGDLAIVRIADGKAMVGTTQAKLDIKPIAACDAIWKPYTAKADALRKAVEKENKENDPRWDEISKTEGDGSDAYRACFAKEAPNQPFFAAAVKQAEAFLATARGK